MLEFADLQSIVKNKMFDTICHEHLEYYSSEVIINLVKKNRLRVFDIKKNDINGGSKQYFICQPAAKYQRNYSKIKNEIKEDKKLKLSSIKTFKVFFNEIKNLKIELTEKIKRLKKKGKIIHCYGASTKGNVLLQFFKISKKLVTYAAERNKKKYGLYTPGTQIKIISEKLSRSKNPDYYLVMPWHFKKEILSREKTIRKKGTKFIFPLPKIKII